MIVVVFTQDNCSWCNKALNLLHQHSYEFQVLNISKRDGKKQQHHKEHLNNIAPEAKTVPQIFIDGKHIGGYEELKEYFNDHIKN
jgi:glutaredoxin